MFCIECRELKKICCVNMWANFNIQVHLFLKFPYQAIPCAFAKFKSASGKLGVIISPYVFITHQHLFFFIDQDAVNSYVEKIHEMYQNIFFFRKNHPMTREMTSERETGM